MPIAAWLHPKTDDIIELGDEHLLADVVPPHFLRGVLAKEQGDKRHQGPGVTITAGLGCPRQSFIQRMLPYICHPMRVVAQTFGTILHKEMGEWNGEPGWLNEEHNPGACTVEGELFGVKMGALIDRRREDWSAIQDYKFGFSGGTKWAKETAEVEHSAQVNMQRLLAIKAGHPVPPTVEMTIWRVDNQWVKQSVPMMSEEMIGRVRPHEADTTVAETFRALDAAYQMSGPHEALATLKPVGATMKFGKGKGCDWCAVRKTCEDAMTGGVL